MKKIFTLAASALLASAAWAGVVTLDLNKPINPSSLEYNDYGIWTQCYNDVDYTWLEFGDEDGEFMLSHLIDGEGASWGGYYWDGFCPAIGGDQTDYGQPGSSASWTTYFGGCMAGGGCVINADGTVTADPAQPYLVAYYSNWAMEGPSNQVMFVDKEGKTTFEPVGVYVCNHPWPYYGCEHGDGFGNPFGEGDYFELIAHGVAADGSEKTVSINLVEFSNGELHALNDWTFFDLSSLGEVESVYFTMNSTDTGDYGMNTAAYFCMDKFQVKGEDDPEPPTPTEIVPANPTANEWYDCGDESGFSKFYFTLPTTDVDGNPLNEENLSYAVWINDGFGNVYQFTFPAEDYTFDLNYDIDEVPYWIYSSAVDFKNYFVYMYRTNENDNPLFVRDDDHNGNIGIQAFYTYDRVKTSSEIAWLYEEVTPPEPPTPTEKTGAPVFNGYTTDGIHAYFIEIQESEPSTIYYRVQFGQNGEFTEWAEYEDILSFTQDGWYRIEAYAIANGKLASDPIAYEFIVNPATGLSEMVGSKTVASTRYFNVAGQEMQEANGLTIVVTTYTDGTTSTVKVMK